MGHDIGLYLSGGEMREAGGPAVQSGILYQNSIAALYLGRLCDPRTRPDSEFVLEVRVEAVAHVDDTVVTFADAHRTFIQAKENIRGHHQAWQKLWQDFGEQFRCQDFQRGKDRLLLHVGETHDEHHALRELCVRAGSSRDYQEWWQRLTCPQRALVDKVTPLIRPEALGHVDLLAFFGHIDVEIRSLTQIERDSVLYWMPQSDWPSKTLFRLLRDRVGGEARHRGSFTSADLRRSLESEGVRFRDASDIDELRAAVTDCGAVLRQHKHTIADTGIHVKRGTVSDIVAWTQDTSNEDRVAVLLDQAGMGKTVIMRDVLCTLDDLDLPVLAIKADQQLPDVSTLTDLREVLCLPDSVERIVGRLASVGPVVVLIDQVDALSLSLARDQKSLNVVLALVARLRSIPGLRVLLSCRTFDWNSDPVLQRSIEAQKKFVLQELTEQEVEDVLRIAGVELKKLPLATRKLIRTPLHLDIFVRALEGQLSRVVSAADMQGVGSLQELYHALWRNVVLKPTLDGPSVSERVDVLRRMTQYMDQKQKTAVPQSLFLTPETEHLNRAVSWLASEGILLATATEWTLMHQTFFDYCYARRFVESDSSLADTILASEQGLFQRPQLVHVLSYLRTSSPTDYLREIQNLFAARDLRFHLQDLLFRWFGSLQNPTNNEWLVARRLLLDPARRPQLLRALHGNSSWFAWLKGDPIGELLAQDDEVLDRQVVPYLDSILNVENTQAEVATLLQPYIGQGMQWNNRIVWMLSHSRNVYAPEAVSLFEQTLVAMPDLDLKRFFHLEDVARSYPRAACRIISLILDRALEGLLNRPQDKDSLWHHSLHAEFRALEGSGLDEVFTIVSQASPGTYLESVLPWVERVVRTRNEPAHDSASFAGDDLSYGWYEDPALIKGKLIESLILALSSQARTQPGEFRETAGRLVALPFSTPQQLLAHVYKAVPEMYAEDAFHFLIGDPRRLNLGDYEQYDSRQLIKAIYPFLNTEQKIGLEASILAYAPIRRYLGVDGLRRRGLEQLYLLQAIPAEHLTAHGIARLKELERKFPGWRAKETPVRGEVGFVGSPIPSDVARKMSDRAWLRAMKKYQGSIEHKDFPKGGAGQLNGVLAELVKEDPERFYRLAQRVPDSVDHRYVQAFLNGLADSEAPATWLFDLIRRFASHPELDVRRTIVWALQKRVKDGLPDDLLALLEQYLRSPADRHVLWTRENGDLDNAYINSERGSSLQTLMRALRLQDSDIARRRQWELLEFVATDSSTVLRAGAIRELLSHLADNREQAVEMFQRLMDGHPVLLCSRFTQDFVYYSLYQHYDKMQPLIRAMMEEEEEEQCQQRGAELACIASISPLAVHSPVEQARAQEMADEVMLGPEAWRRGAARVYAFNITKGSSTTCEQRLTTLLNDEAIEVQRHVGEVFHHLKADHMHKLRTFIECYAASRSLHAGMHTFIEYFWKHGLLDPVWTLSIIAITLRNRPPMEQPRWLPDGEKLIRLTLRIYNDPIADASMRRRAMDVLDGLMEQYAGQAAKVLGEWDRK